MTAVSMRRPLAMRPQKRRLSSPFGDRRSVLATGRGGGSVPRQHRRAEAGHPTQATTAMGTVRWCGEAPNGPHTEIARHAAPAHPVAAVVSLRAPRRFYGAPIEPGRCPACAGERRTATCDPSRAPRPATTNHAAGRTRPTACNQIARTDIHTRRPRTKAATIARPQRTRSAVRAATPAVWLRRRHGRFAPPGTRTVAIALRRAHRCAAWAARNAFHPLGGMHNGTVPEVTTTFSRFGTAHESLPFTRAPFHQPGASPCATPIDFPCCSRSA